MKLMDFIKLEQLLLDLYLIDQLYEQLSVLLKINHILESRPGSHARSNGGVGAASAGDSIVFSTFKFD
jgi:hypothetical protein